MYKLTSISKINKYLWPVFFYIVTLRLITMFIFPLNDTTEARYGEIARKMLETNNWITPWHDYGVPFWAKPPLSFWASASSMKLFGVNEFAARLPSLIFMVLILFMVKHLIQVRYDKDYGLLGMVILFSMPMFFIVSGTVMTDASLACTVFMSFTSFWLGMQEPQISTKKTFGYLFFIALGLGLLAKGPICLVLTLPPIFVWLCIQKKWHEFFAFLPIVQGTILMLIIAAPWYILAEYRTPGFLNYFIIGEHIGRFLIPGWNGDQYGNAHQEPLGMIWFYMSASIFPWSLIIFYWFIKNFKNLNFKNQDSDGWSVFLICWALWPLLFFSVAQNIIMPYVITALPPVALLIVDICSKNKIDTEVIKKWLMPLFLFPTLLISIGIVYMTVIPEDSIIRNKKLFAQKFLELRESDASQLYSYRMRKYSTEFYTHGIARNTSKPDDINNLINNSTRDFIIVKHNKLPPDPIMKNFNVVITYGEYSLLEEKNKADLPV